MHISQSPFKIAAFLISALQGIYAQQKVAPAPNGTYIVGLSIVELIDTSREAAFAPSPQPLTLELSIFYPASGSNTQNVSYFPPETARLLDLEHEQYFDLNSPNGTFEQLEMVVAANGTNVATPPATKWPILLFSGASGTTRLFYNSIAAHVASSGYVIVTIDTPYDTDVVQFSDGTIAEANATLIAISNSDNITAVEAIATEDANYRATNAPFVLDQFSNQTWTSSLIPGCNDCLNTTQVGIFGHSIGGASAATAMLNDNRFVGGINYDGEMWGDVVEQGLDRPFMIMITSNQTIASDPSWSTIWPKLTGEKYGLILADSLHYTYSDIPVALETLDITPNATTMAAEQITDQNGDRSLYIITSYTTAFFDQVLKGNTSELLKGPSPQFWEIAFDNGTNGTSGSGNPASYVGSASSSKGMATTTLLVLTFITIGFCSL